MCDLSIGYAVAKGDLQKKTVCGGLAAALRASNNIHCHWHVAVMTNFNLIRL
jgi:hypothetical protein